jgi:hypothetical protein
MSINRVLVVLPLLAGLVLAGTAVARMMPVQTVRDSVYGVRDSASQTCAHNGVHYNKQGHANCGLHLGWSDTGSTQGSTEDTGGSEPGDQGGTSSGDAGTTHGGGHGHAHHAKPAHSHKSPHGHSGATVQHGHSGHAGHASSHGHGHSHSKG